MRWRSVAFGAVLVLLGANAGAVDAGAAVVALVLLILIARLVYNAGGVRWLLAFAFSAVYGAPS